MNYAIVSTGILISLVKLLLIIVLNNSGCLNHVIKLYSSVSPMNNNEFIWALPDPRDYVSRSRNLLSSNGMGQKMVL